MVENLTASESRLRDTDIAKAMMEHVRNQILTDTEEEQIPLFEFNYRAAVCEQCKKIVSVPSIYLHQKDYVYTGTCAECENAVVALNEGAEIVCPCCKAAVLSEKETGSILPPTTISS